MAKIKNRRRETTSPAVSVAEKIPLVSVIIPMYNAAKFVTPALESLTVQTIKDFEIVVVDDGSTDNSVEVVESFKEHLASSGVKLHVVQLNKNSGTPNLPRNVGINFARGKYIAFLDSDDFLTPTALEELSTLAEKFQADVVHSDTFFLLDGETKTVCQRQKLPVVSEPIFETNDFAQRIRQWVSRGYNWEPYTMFCKRDFLVKNQIVFPKLRSYGDMIFSFSVLCLAEKFLRVPNLTYTFQKREGSVSYENSADDSKRFLKYIRILNDGFTVLGKIMSTLPFFKQHPDYRYAILDFYFSKVLNSIRPVYSKNNPLIFIELMKKECQSYDADLVAYLFNMVNIYHFNLMKLQQEKINGKK